MSEHYTTAIIVAAGDSTRMGYKLSKQLIPLCGRPAIAYTSARFRNAEMIDEIIVVCRPQDIDDIADIAFQFKLRSCASPPAARIAWKACARASAAATSARRIMRSMTARAC